MPSGTILLVEDDETLCLIIEKRLAHAGIELVTARTGMAALEKFEANEYRLVLMDIRLPDMDGIEATNRIREFELKNRRGRVPIIAMTAFGERDLCIRAGMDHFMVKPLDFDVFDQLVSMHLKIS